MEYYSALKKEGLSEASYKVSKPRNKPDTKGWILYDSTYMGYPEKSKSWRQKEWWLAGAGNATEGVKIQMLCVFYCSKKKGRRLEAQGIFSWNQGNWRSWEQCMLIGTGASRTSGKEETGEWGRGGEQVGPALGRGAGKNSTWSCSSIFREDNTRLISEKKISLREGKIIFPLLTILGSLAGVLEMRQTEKRKMSLLVCASSTHVGELSSDWCKWVVRACAPRIVAKDSAFLEKWQVKGKGLWASRGSKLWESKYMGTFMGDKDSFLAGLLCGFLWGC